MSTTLIKPQRLVAIYHTIADGDSLQIDVWVAAFGIHLEDISSDSRNVVACITLAF